MAKRKIEIFDVIHNEKELENVLKNNPNTLIMAEIFCYFAGHCIALDKLYATIKLDWSSNRMIMLKVPADEIEAFERFRDQSEPVFMFILRGRVTKVFRGVDSMKLGELAKKELFFWNKEAEGATFNRPTYALDEATPEEAEWIHHRELEKQQEQFCRAALRSGRRAARKRHRAELMVPHLDTLNFVLFWPHCVHAHPELYERWDANNIVMVAREVLQLTEEKAQDILYDGEPPLNEASLQTLLSGPALAICFRLLDHGAHIVTLVRKILYEDLPVYDETKPADQQLPRVTAFDYYKTSSPSRQEVWRQRREDRAQRRVDQIEQRKRRLSEMQRLARQAIEEAKEAKKVKKENRRMELLKAGKSSQLDQESDEENIDIEIPEELPDEFVEVESEEEDVNEYMPPAGLLIPGFYAPSNDVAKANGLAVLFPKIVADYVTPEPEILPPHVLVMMEISKRHKVIETISSRKANIIHMGIFKALTPYDNIIAHIAYTVKQYDSLAISLNPEEVTLVFMLSVQTDFALLDLMDLHPVHVSRDPVRGEDECAHMFPLNYADEYDEFEDFIQNDETE